MATIDAATGQVVEPRKPGIPAKDRPTIPADQFTVTVPDADSRVDFRRQREELTEQEKAVVDLTKEVYSDWVEAKRPLNWVDIPIRVWDIETKYAESALFMLRKACRILGRKPKFGNIKEYTHPDTHKKMTQIPFGVVARDARVKGKPDSDADE